MTPLFAVFRGLATSFKSPGILLGLWLLNLLLVLPAAWSIAGSLEQDIGASRMHETLRTGFDMDWYSEYRHRAQGLDATFEPSKVVGIGPFLDNLEAWVGGQWIKSHPILLGLMALHGLIWILLLGGILDRFADRGGILGFDRFMETCGRHFFRFLRLALISAPLYYLVYRMGRWLLQRIADGSRDADRETPILIAVLLTTLGVAIALHLVRMVFDYGKIITFLEDRRSALGAALSGALFVLRHPLRTVGVDLAFALLGLLGLLIFKTLGPGTAQQTALQIFAAFALGQLWVLGRLVLRLGLLSAELETYRFEERR